MGAKRYALPSLYVIIHFMATWNSRGLRGSTFEDMINRTNEIYLSENLALIQKIPTPITPVEMDKSHHQITLAYFDQRSTVDYIGVVQGVAVCFDAKECAKDTFPLQNIHEHQIQFMQSFEEQDGIAFMLIYYSSSNEFYYMRLRELMVFWNRMLDGGRKSIRKEELDSSYYIKQERGFVIPYLKALSRDLEARD